MKKLLQTTALVGASAIVASASVAEVNISGNYTHTMAFGTDETTSGSDSDNRLGGEFNITFKATNELDNGMSAKLNANMESDGDSNGFDDREYSLSIGTDSTYLQLSSDKGNSTNSSVVPTVGYHPGTYADITGTTGNTTVFQDTLVANIVNDENVSLNAKTAGGTLTLRYTPKNDQSPGNDNQNIISGTSGSGTEIVYNGSPMEGFKISAGYIEKQESDSTDGDDEFSKIGASYNFGSYTVGVEWMDFDDGSSNNATGAESMWYGVTAALSDNVSVGLSYAKQEDQAANSVAPDEKLKTLEIGYNLGGASLVIAAQQVDNAQNVETADQEGLVTRLKMSF